MGQALEKKYGCDLTIGPALKDGGFYYDMSLAPKADGTPRLLLPLIQFYRSFLHFRSGFGQDEYAAIEQLVNQVVKVRFLLVPTVYVLFIAALSH